MQWHTVVSLALGVAILALAGAIGLREGQRVCVEVLGPLEGVVLKRSGSSSLKNRLDLRRFSLSPGSYLLLRPRPAVRGFDHGSNTKDSIGPSG